MQIQYIVDGIHKERDEVAYRRCLPTSHASDQAEKGKKVTTKEPSKSRQRTGLDVMLEEVCLIDGALLRLTRLDKDDEGPVALTVSCVTPSLFATMDTLCCSLPGNISSSSIFSVT